MATIAIYPKQTRYNSVIDTTRSIIEKKYKIVDPLIAKDLFHFKKRTDVVILNWLESLIVKGHGLQITSITKFIAYTIIYRIHYRKIIFVYHNKYPHECTTKLQKIVGKTAVRLLLQLSDAVVTHDPTDQKHYYIPHPLYPGETKQHTEGKKTEEYFIIFGAVKRYKKIENLLRNWNAEWNLLIVGECKDEQYLRSLKSIHNQKVTIRSALVSEVELDDLIDKSSGIIIDYWDESMIVTGTFFKGISRSKHVFINDKYNFAKFYEKRIPNNVIHTYRDNAELMKYISQETWRRSEYIDKTEFEEESLRIRWSALIDQLMGQK